MKVKNVFRATELSYDIIINNNNSSNKINVIAMIK